MATAEQELLKLTECCICLKGFTDPRILPCIHTFCLQCLKQTVETAKKQPEEIMSCPICRKEFRIPTEGMSGLQKNFLMENLMDVATKLQPDQKPVTVCDLCKAIHEGDEEMTKEATMRCLECRENFCDMCSKTHKYAKLSKSHNIVKIGNKTHDEDLKKCGDHSEKPLDCYCEECKKRVCVSCMCENHASHKCKEVTKIEKEMRQTLEADILKISSYADGICMKAEAMEQRKTEYLLKAEKIGFEIQRRNQELLEMIDDHTKSLLDELSVIKQKRIKEFENEKKEIECFHTILKSFEVYSTELHSRGSSNDINSCINAMLKTANELEKEHETFLGRPCLSTDLSFEVTDLEIIRAAKSNVVGRIQETAPYFENNLVLVGLNTDGRNITNDVFKINLHRPNEVSKVHQLPSTCRMVNEAAAAIHDNTIYLIGIGFNCDEIWKYNSASSWVKCASVVQGRRRHCAGFLDGVLYICGGVLGYVGNRIWNMFSRVADPLDSVEAYDVVAYSCTTVGKLVYGIHSSGNCVPFKSSLYIFGGSDKADNALDQVQVYDTKQNICTSLTQPMPRSYRLMRAALWETSVILLGCDTCFIFNFESETWQEREQFKTEVVDFGLALENGRIFVIGGGICEMDKGGKAKWRCRDDVRYVPLQDILDDKPVEWKINATLPGGTLVSAYAVTKEFLEFNSH